MNAPLPPRALIRLELLRIGYSHSKDWRIAQEIAEGLEPFVLDVLNDAPGPGKVAVKDAKPAR